MYINNSNYYLYTFLAFDEASKFINRPCSIVDRRYVKINLNLLNESPHHQVFLPLASWENHFVYTGF